MASGLVCACCGKQKDKLQAKSSKLLSNQKLIMCADCIAKKYEPRGIIVLIGQQQGFHKIAEYIEKHRYAGPPIEAREILPT